MWWCLGIVVALVALFGVLLLIIDQKGKADGRAALAARGSALGTWTVFYDVKACRIGLNATFSQPELVRFLFFRAHDLFDYLQGMEGERRALAEQLKAAASGQPTKEWALLFPVAAAECFHAYDSPKATLFKFFEGTLHERAVDQPRFLGGDSIAKQQGLVGECVAIAAHLSRDPRLAPQLVRALDVMIDQELTGGRPGTGAKFWARPVEALHSTGLI